MIKNILYSLFIHLLLFLVIYFSLSKNNLLPENFGDEEIIISLDIPNQNMQGAPPINEEEIIKKLPPEDDKKLDTKPKINEQKAPKNKSENKLENQSQIQQQKTAELRNTSEKDNDKNSNPPQNNALLEKKIDKILDPKQPQQSAELNKNIQPQNPLDTLKNQEKIDEKIQNIPPKTEPKTEPVIEKKPVEKTDESSEKTTNVKKLFKNFNLQAFKNISQNIQGSLLSARENINIKSQIKSCYKRAIEESGIDNPTQLIVKISVSKDGSIRSNLDDIIDIKKYNDPSFMNYKITFDNVKRALEICSPLRNLPIEKYDSWKELTLEFDDKINN